MNQQTLTGYWNQVRGKLKETWSELTDEELDHVEGNVEQLVGLLQQKSGEARDSIEHQLEALLKECEQFQSTDQKLGATAQHCAEQASEGAKHLVHEVAESVQHSSEYLGEAVKHGYQETGQLVRTRPVQSLAVTFGAGLVAGVIVGLLLRRP